MALSIVSVSAPTSADTGQEICPPVVISNTSNDTVKVAVAWDGDPIDNIEPESQIDLGPATVTEVDLDLNNDGAVNVLDLTIAKNKLNSGEWTQAEFDVWHKAFLYGIMPVRPSQGTAYPSVKLMPAQSVSWKINLLTYDYSSATWVSTGTSKSVNITNTGGGGNGGGGGDGGSGTSWLSNKWVKIGLALAAIVTIGAISLSVLKKK